MFIYNPFLLGSNESLFFFISSFFDLSIICEETGANFSFFFVADS